MALLVLDSSRVSCLSMCSRDVAALLAALHREGAWPPIVPLSPRIASNGGVVAFGRADN